MKGALTFFILVLLTFSSPALAIHDGEEVISSSDRIWASDITIRINSNADLISQAALNGWPGNGTIGNPYMIENRTYENITRTAIFMGNITLHFIIRNITISNLSDPSETALVISNCNNGTVIENHIHNMDGDGIGVYGSVFYDIGQTISIISNRIDGVRIGIYASYLSGTRFINNSVKNSTLDGLYFGHCRDLFVSGNNCSFNGHSGMKINGGGLSTYQNNTCSNNSYYAGINVEYTSGGETFRNNTCNGNNGTGIIYRPRWSKANITENTCSRNTYRGIYLAGFAEVRENQCSRNGDNGIHIHQVGAGITLNTLTGNGLSGLFVNGSGNDIDENMINGNMETGIMLINGQNRITNNTVTGNTNSGIELRSNMNRIEKNDLHENLIGIISNSSSGNVIRDNTFGNDSMVNIMVYKGSDNTIEYNRFDLEDQAGVSVINSSGASIVGNDIYGSHTSGIILQKAVSCTVRGNDLTYPVNTTTMYVEDSALITMEDNRFEGGGEVSISDSMGVDLQTNLFIDMNIGLNLERSPVSGIFNGFYNCGVNISTLSYYNPWIGNIDMDSSNMVNGKPIRMIQVDGNMSLNGGDTGQVILWKTWNTTIVDLIMENTGVGIQLFETDNTTITNCHISRTDFGLKAVRNDGLYVKGTTFFSCARYGIHLNNVVGGAIRDNLIWDAPLIDSDHRELSGAYIKNSKGLGIHGNTFFSHDQIKSARGLVIDFTDYCRIWDNYFFYYGGTGETYNRSRTQVYDVNGVNEWTSKKGIGNYFRDNTGPDDDGDGIVDELYLVGGKFGLDLYDTAPMPTCPVVAPPKIVQYIPAEDMIYLRWSEPAQTNLTEILSYNIYRGANDEDPEMVSSVHGSLSNFFDYDVLVNTTYHYYVTAVNTLIESDPSNMVSMVLDTKAPSLNITNPGNNTYHKENDLTIRWVMNDTESGIMHVEIALDDDQLLPIGNATEYAFINLNEGKHTVTVRVWDNALRWNQETVTFTVDTVPMELGFIGPANGSLIAGSSADMVWTYRDATSGPGTFRLESENGSLIYQGSETSYTILDLPDGEHTITLIGIDRAGNENSTEITFTTDSTTPELRLISPQDGLLTRYDNIKVEWEGDDNGTGLSGFFFQLNDYEWEDLGPSRYDKSLWQLNDGHYTIRIKAIDNAGNEIIVSSSIIVDGTRPDLRIISPMDGSYLSELPVSIKWNGTDDTSGLDHYEISLDGSNWIFQDTRVSYTIVNLEEGSYVIRVRMHDRAGNSHTVSTGFVLDQTVPEATSWGPTGEGIKVDSTFSVSFTERMDKRITQFKVTDVEGQIRWNGDRAIFVPNSDLEYGSEYEVTVVAWDLAGNRMNTLTWTIRTDYMGSLSGYVVDSDGDPIKGAVLSMDENIITTTDENGYFFFVKESGTDTITITAEGYLDVDIDILITAGEDTHIDRIVMTSESGPPVQWSTIILIAVSILLSLGVITIIGIRIRGGGEEGFEE